MANEVVRQQARDGIYENIKSECIVIYNGGRDNHYQVLDVDYKVEVVDFRVTSHFEYECQQHGEFGEVDCIV